MYFRLNESWEWDDIRLMVWDTTNKISPKIVCTITEYYSEYGKLLAAAPDLLMACKAAKGLLEGLDRTKGGVVYKDIKEAINKAEGKEI